MQPGTCYQVKREASKVGVAPFPVVPQLRPQRWLRWATDGLCPQRWLKWATDTISQQRVSPVREGFLLYPALVSCWQGRPNERVASHWVGFLQIPPGIRVERSDVDSLGSLSGKWAGVGAARVASVSSTCQPRVWFSDDALASNENVSNVAPGAMPACRVISRSCRLLVFFC